MSSTVGNLVFNGMSTYRSLLRKSNAKNIREDTRTSIYKRINAIEDSIDEIIANRKDEFTKRELLITLIPNWQLLKETRYTIIK